MRTVVLNYPLLYVEHLSEGDLDLLDRATAHGGGRETLRERLGADPDLVDAILADPGLFETVFDEHAVDLEVGVTPLLTFGVLVHRSMSDLRDAAHVMEWTAPGRRLPVFDVDTLRAFLDDGTRRFFVVELLASFTKIASGSMWVRTRHGMRRRRYSELDMARLAEKVEQLPASDRPAGYRRLGDVALFLAGVFPDHTASHPPRPMERERVARSAGIPVTDVLSEPGDLGFHELAGAGSYRRAVETAASLVGRGPEFLLDIADRFHEARRVLNYLADRYLHRRDSGLMRPAG